MEPLRKYFADFESKQLKARRNGFVPSTARTISTIFSWKLKNRFWRRIIVLLNLLFSLWIFKYRAHTMFQRMVQLYTVISRNNRAGSFDLCKATTILRTCFHKWDKELSFLHYWYQCYIYVRHRPGTIRYPIFNYEDIVSLNTHYVLDFTSTVVIHWECVLRRVLYIMCNFWIIKFIIASKVVIYFPTTTAILCRKRIILY